MKIIHKREPGKESNYGINYYLGGNTKFELVFRLPLPIIKYLRNYFDDWRSNYCSGFQIVNVYFYARLRDKTKFPSGFRPLWVFHAGCYWVSLGKQKLLYTREQLEDGLVNAK